MGFDDHATAVVKNGSGFKYHLRAEKKIYFYLGFIFFMNSVPVLEK
jgi:hypothetical protein